MLEKTARRCHFGSQPSLHLAFVFLPPPTLNLLELGGSYLRRGKSQTPVILDSLSSSGQNISRVCDLKEGRSHPTVYVPTKLVKKEWKQRWSLFWRIGGVRNTSIYIYIWYAYYTYIYIYIHTFDVLCFVCLYRFGTWKRKGARGESQNSQVVYFNKLNRKGIARKKIVEVWQAVDKVASMMQVWAPDMSADQLLLVGKLARLARLVLGGSWRSEDVRSFWRLRMTFKLLGIIWAEHVCQGQKWDINTFQKQRPKWLKATFCFSACHGIWPSRTIARIWYWMHCIVSCLQCVSCDAFNFSLYWTCCFAWRFPNTTYNPTYNPLWEHMSISPSFSTAFFFQRNLKIAQQKDQVFPVGWFINSLVEIKGTLMFFSHDFSLLLRPMNLGWDLSS